MSNHLADKVVVITGAAGGFGKILAGLCAARGASVVCADIDDESLSAAVKEITDAGGVALGHVTDVRDQAAMHELVKVAVDQYTRVDVMVNNAGVMPLAFYADHQAAGEAWDRCIDINFKGVVHGIVACHDVMLAQGRGHVVNLSSIYGNFPVVGAGVYGATKAAVDFLSASLRAESQGKIKVTTVKPTGVPGTNLGSGIVNEEAIVGILGHNAARYGQQLQSMGQGDAPLEYTDVDHIEYAALEPQYLAQQILYAIDQPWGVSISDITVRASGDGYIL